MTADQAQQLIQIGKELVSAVNGLQLILVMFLLFKKMSK